jgi:glucose-6-phosphate isomerase
MTLHLDDRYFLRSALDGVHGLADDALAQLAARFPEIRTEVVRRRHEGEFGFLGLGHQPDLVARANAFADARRGTFDHLLVLGIGGSALGMRALMTALRPAAWNEWGADRRDGWPTVTILENVDPTTVLATLDRLDPRRTLVNVISKSGGTAETLAQYLIVRQWLARAVGDDTAREHLVFTTDPVRGALRAIAADEGIATFDVPPEVGGRFSVLTAVGLVPAALAGLDIAGLVDGAAIAVAEAESESLDTNPAARWAGLQFLAQATTAANIHVLMPYSDHLKDISAWFCQLWAESLGKEHDRAGTTVFRGPTPLGALGATDQHSQVQLFIEGPYDKTITFLRVRDSVGLLEIPPHPPTAASASPVAREALGYLEGKTLGQLLDAEFVATREALRSCGRMSATLELDTVDARSLGRLLMFFQCATGFAGAWYDVNPFDQPGVELGKVLTKKALDE